MPYIIKMQPPTGPAEYMPDGFGFTCHAHSTNPNDAKRYDTAEQATRTLHARRYPPAFWESERLHRQRVEEEFRRWTFSVEEVTS